ncbi:Hypothetical predicted protein [Podarcis lilfordi]|uniref:Uncharacterized protein n=1 Tax=Podarcis lilfordi TaxID=74358 RepID=A0AA35P684_9SAUR|nr:Hypothetical predicted protein [Podarcis lilfordi]
MALCHPVMYPSTFKRSNLYSSPILHLIWGRNKSRYALSRLAHLEPLDSGTLNGFHQNLHRL